MYKSEDCSYRVAFEDGVQEGVIKEQRGAKASLNHTLLLRDCSRKRWCSSSGLIGFAVGVQSPLLPMGNTGNNWWLKLTWVLRGHEISFNFSPDSPPPRSLEEKAYLHCSEPLRLTYAMPPRSGEIAFECCYWFYEAECRRGRGIERGLCEDAGSSRMRRIWKVNVSAEKRQSSDPAGCSLAAWHRPEMPQQKNGSIFNLLRADL